MSFCGNIEVPACHPRAGKTRGSEATPMTQESWRSKVSPLQCRSGLLSEPPCSAPPSTDTNVFYHIEGSRQALKVVFYLDGFHFSRLPSRLEGGASLRLHTVLLLQVFRSLAAWGRRPIHGLQSWEGKRRRG